ncbi:hypothetical protein [Paramesorhizobium deserti]|uniref:hypothetical protein n=1 Tax=Paramesorhizobium deserti TaxID=1494590 RepID=UPI0012908934|nr:hypothetical protein [Paramesorhizobium deserti]
MSHDPASRLLPFPANRNADHGESVKQRMKDDAILLYGSNAPTAVACCALAAWCEDKKDEYKFWSEIFLQLQDGPGDA